VCYRVKQLRQVRHRRIVFSLSEEVGTALGAQAGETRLADVFRKAGFRKFGRAKATPFNLILEVKAGS